MRQRKAPARAGVTLSFLQAEPGTAGMPVGLFGATHLFEETGALEAVAKHAAAWFARHLMRAGVPPPRG